MSSSSEEIAEALAQQVKGLSTRCGVYFMRDAAGDVLYVGKAKNIRARVRSYFRGQDERPQVQFLLRKVVNIETIIADTENQAFILERDLISKFKPRYNIRLKDNKEYLSIRLDRNSEWPRIELVRQVQQDGAQYFGPYSFSYELKRLLDLIKRVVPLRTCNDTVFYNRQRPCLEHQIKRCAGPCCLPVNRGQYGAWIKQAIAILEGRSDSLVAQLTKDMEQFSADMLFEEAAVYRDRLSALQSAKENSAYYSNRADSQDVFVVYRQQGLATISVLRLRNGRIKESFNYSFENVVSEDDELIETCILQFYEAGHGLSDEIIIPFALPDEKGLGAALQRICGDKPEVSVAQRGTKFRLLQLAKLNAQQHFVSRFEEESRTFDTASELARLLKLKQVPRRIECVDISNFQGSDIVGGLVAFVDGKPEKNLYRRYTISFQNKPDDFAAIYEVVTRRLQRAKEDQDFPDLLLIDGGAMQLAKALEARDALGVSLDIVSLAKIREIKNPNRYTISGSTRKPERFFVEGGKLPIELDAGNPVTLMVQRMRDEVHRFVLSFHREKRSKRFIKSALDGISGLGPDKRRRLLTAFGSIEQLSKAAPEEIAKTGRMPLTLAHKVLLKIKSPLT